MHPSHLWNSCLRRMCYDLSRMMRSVTYRQAINAFLFTGLWFVFGGIVLWSPVPGALGIGGEMFSAWVLLFCGALAISGVLLTVAGLNGAFPRRPKPHRRGASTAARTSGEPMWAPRAERAHSAGRREG